MQKSIGKKELLEIFRIFSKGRKLSSPRAKRAGPKGPRAESARAVTGRRCPHSGVGEDFLERRPGSPHENGCNSGTKSRRLDPKVPTGANAEGYERPFDKKRGPIRKNGFSGPKSGFFGPKKRAHFLVKYASKLGVLI